MGAVPTRTCTGCRARRPQGELLRVSRRADGRITVDAGISGRSPGRGAYVCFDAECVKIALRTGRLRRTLRLEAELPEGLRERLLEAAAEGRETKRERTR